MSRRGKRRSQAIDIPFGRVELLGQVIHVVQHDGHLITLGAGPPDGRPTEILAARGNSEAECRELMHRSVDMLFDLIDRAPMLCVPVGETAPPNDVRRNGHTSRHRPFGAEPGSSG